MLDVDKIKRELAAGAHDSGVLSNIIVELAEEINHLSRTKANANHSHTPKEPESSKGGVLFE